MVRQNIEGKLVNRSAKGWISSNKTKSGKIDVIAQNLFESGLIVENLISSVAIDRRLDFSNAMKDDSFSIISGG